ncbi:hypothetical protein [Synechococcus sp. CCY 9618]|uniref:hypothetical protein n=1 Tax=Synechococcus sp. CCY 9618 TaxID=2815602 RepID=UPI001C23985A|nr:hypothetical protein [Synechococcus sp. CCY 9618]
MKTAPVPWSLTWREDGELASQDLFDLLQTLVASESHEVQTSLIAAVERLSVSQLQVMACEEVTRICA